MADLAGVFASGKENQVTRPRVFFFNTFAKFSLFSRIAGQFNLRHVQIYSEHHARTISAYTLLRSAVFVRSSDPRASLLYHAGLFAVHVSPLYIDTGIYRRSASTTHRPPGRTSRTSQHRKKREHTCNRHKTRREPFHDDKVSNFTPNRKTVMRHFTQGARDFFAVFYIWLTHY